MKRFLLLSLAVISLSSILVAGCVAYDPYGRPQYVGPDVSVGVPDVYVGPGYYSYGHHSYYRHYR
jgi:hypothetical protein